MVTRLLARAYYELVYAPKDALWRLEKTGPNQDQLREWLRGFGLSSGYLNLFLDGEGVSPKIGRFPYILRRQNLVDRIASTCEEFRYYPRKQLFLPEDKKHLIAIKIADALKKEQSK